MPRGYRFELMIFHKPDLDCWGSSVIPFLSSYPYTHLNYSRVGVTEKQAIKSTIGLRMFIFNDAFVRVSKAHTCTIRLIKDNKEGDIYNQARRNKNVEDLFLSPKRS